MFIREVLMGHYDQADILFRIFFFCPPRLLVNRSTLFHLQIFTKQYFRLQFSYNDLHSSLETIVIKFGMQISTGSRWLQMVKIKIDLFVAKRLRKCHILNMFEYKSRTFNKVSMKMRLLISNKSIPKLFLCHQPFLSTHFKTFKGSGSLFF